MDLKLIRVAESLGDVEGVFETAAGEMYRVRVTPDYYVIERINEDPPA